MPYTYLLVQLQHVREEHHGERAAVLSSDGGVALAAAEEGHLADDAPGFELGDHATIADDHLQGAAEQQTEP